MLASKLMHVPSVRTMKVAVISNEAIENKKRVCVGYLEVAHHHSQP
jgi:hypothetical protein